MGNEVQTNRNDLITTRDGIDKDRNFIFATWLRALRYGNEWFEAIDADSYYQYYHKVIEIVLNNPSTQVKVSCLIEDPDIILGYSISSGDRLDFVFVKKAWRNIGIGKSLVPSNFKTVTHLTETGKSILKTKEGIKFNPFALQ